MKKATGLSDVDDPWTENRNYIRALKYADPARKQLLEAVKQRRDMRLEDERNNRLRRADEERRNQELAKVISEGKQKIDEMDYEGAFQVLSENGAGSPECDRLIEIARKGMELQELLSDKEFLDIPLKRDHWKDFARMQRLESRKERFDLGYPIFWALGLIAGIVLFVLAYLIGTSGDMNAPREGAWDYIWMFLGPILMVVFLLAGIVLMAVGLVNFIRAVYGVRVEKAYNVHINEVIEPLINAELERLKNEYEPLLGEAFLYLLIENTKDNPYRKELQKWLH